MMFGFKVYIFSLFVFIINYKYKQGDVEKMRSLSLLGLGYWMVWGLLRACVLMEDDNQELQASRSIFVFFNVHQGTIEVGMSRMWLLWCG